MKNQINNMNAFPFVNVNASETKWNKTKHPYRVTDKEIASKYEQDGHEVLGMSDMQEGYRFNMATIHLVKPQSDKEYTNKITLSKPSAEVMCVRKVDGELQVCLILQPRTPYQVEVNGKTYARFFLEQPAGLLENGESFEEAAIREVEEETGYKVKEVQRLIKSMICRHVSYADETSVVFLANLGDFEAQHLDENEDIKVSWYPVNTVEKEFEDYLEGEKDNFFGYDIPEMTLLAMQRFFVKLHRGDFSF